MKLFGDIARFILLLSIKALSHLFFRFQVEWVTTKHEHNFKNLRLMILLNHTSLYEPIFLSVLPFRVLWQAATKLSFPIADKTKRRPFVGKFFSLLAPHVIPISRSRDETWLKFMDLVSPDSLIAIAPEGRMKRLTGLDKEGKPMTVRGGVGDILASMDSGLMLLAYSGGLHHVQAPGQRFPRIFRKVKINFELCEISAYKERIGYEDSRIKMSLAIAKDLQSRRDTHCPNSSFHGRSA